MNESVIIVAGDEDEALFGVLANWMRGETVGTARLHDALERASTIAGAPVVPTENEIEAWIESKGTTLWGDFLVADENGRRQAALWLRAQMTSLHAFAKKERRK